MGNRAIPAFLLIALLVPLPKAISPPSQAAAGPFVDIPPATSIQAVALTRRIIMLRGLDALSRNVPLPASAAAVAPRTQPAPAQSRPATLEAGVGTRRSRPDASKSSAALPPLKAVAARRTSAAHIAAPLRYRVMAGDTLFAIARRHGTTVKAMATANALPSAHLLRIGQELIVPTGPAAARSTTAATARPAAKTLAPAARKTAAPAPRKTATAPTYEVQTGDTLFAIARRHATTVNAIVAANALPSAHRLRIGQRLVLPTGSRPSQTVSRTVRAVRTTLSWPARGVITSRYGWRYRRHHDGIDIASARGTPIYAARSGRVVFAGWYYGYGRAVIIDHGGGVTTRYGHASALLVRTGQIVAQGHLIARVGCTGQCTGSHLHFEVRVNGRAVNPLPYLR